MTVRASLRQDNKAEEISLPEALKISDAAATKELQRVETEVRSRNANVILRLSDYKVSVREDGATYWLFYEHDNPHVPFMRWFGHPMHFSIYVDKRSGEMRMFGGR